MRDGTTKPRWRSAAVDAVAELLTWHVRHEAERMHSTPAANDGPEPRPVDVPSRSRSA